jgi:hypothetical protein
MRDLVVTRVQHSGPLRRSRNLEERLLVRFPSLYRRLGTRFSRLSPRSRLRQALLHRAVVSGWAASSRRDFRLMLVRYAPEVVGEFDPALADFGLGETLLGHEGYVKGLRTFREAWERWEAMPTTILDMGDRVVVLGTLRLTGNVSGLEFEHEMVQLLTLRSGLVAREQIFLAPDEGLRAAGLDPDTIALASQGKARQAGSTG